ncbi:hypothetical protein CR194_12815 [Salipaludibacillus keqinensis]|uniref:ATP-grasp domain-containing protein n=1 Tax=Salipaludibacillus keqinensis TaxID=2045207 RepID=A0A323TSX7_9BACI|nr:ATP-grasp domain-containing protein [Salipaludibacillus keqinensis]PYZ92545.1 hypothetical protein CR194_12815 [Salipaludibacillus keqinensis]
MKNNEQHWLPHLSPQVVEEAKGHLLCGYTIALEGWRRGLQLTWYTDQAAPFQSMKTWYVHKPGKLFSLSSSTQTHYFFRSRGDLVSNEAVEAGGDKGETKKILLSAQVPTPKGDTFSSDVTDEAIKEFAVKLGYPLVLKPVNGSFGRGVISNISNDEDLAKALYLVRGELNEKEVIVEEYLPGKEYRLYVVGDKVVGAIERVPANVTGDGTATIRELMEAKNRQRKDNPRLVSCPIEIDDELMQKLEKEGRSLETVPGKDEVVFLREKSNISLGGDPVDRLDELSDEVKRIAIEALQAFPDFHHGGVDVITPSSDYGSDAVVLEVNPTAQIGSLLFPMKGKGRNIPSAIIDYYFPESKSQANKNRRTAFHFKELLLPLETRATISVDVPPPTSDKRYHKTLIVAGELNELEFKQGLKKAAVRMSVSGFMEAKSKHTSFFYIQSDSEEKLGQFVDYIQGEQSVQHVELFPMDHSLLFFKQGFEIREDKNQVMKDLKRLKRNMKKLQRKQSLLVGLVHSYTSTKQWGKRAYSSIKTKRVY